MSFQKIVFIITLMNGIIIFSVGTVLGHGFGAFSEFTYGKTYYDRHNEAGVKRNFIVGWNMDANVSTNRIFHYQLNLGFGYVNVSHAYSRKYYFEWDNKRISDPFNDAGYTVHLRHVMSWALWRNPPWRVMVGPHVRLHYDWYTANPRSNWQMHPISGGIHCDVRYDLSLNYTLEVSLLGEFSSFSSNETEPGNEHAIGFRVSLIKTKERIEKPEEDQPVLPEPVDLFEPEPEIDDKTEKSEAVSKPEEVPEIEPVLNKFTNMTSYSFAEPWQREKDKVMKTHLVIETFPARCSLSINGKNYNKSSELMLLENIPVGPYNLVFTWQNLTLHRSIDLEPGRYSFISASFPTNKILSKPLFKGRYILYDDGTIEDIQTNLMWLQQDFEKAMDWKNSMRACQELKFTGYSDWHLPSQSELMSLLNPPEVDEFRATDLNTIPGLFHISHAQLWSSDQGELSAIMADRRTAYINLRKAEIEWTMPFRRMGALPVRWITSRALPQTNKALDSIEHEMSLTSEQLLNDKGYIMLDERNFAQEIFGSRKPSVVFFYEASKQGAEGLASVFNALAEAYKNVINFCVYEVDPNQKEYVQPRYHYSSPGSIVLFGDRWDKRQQLDVFDDHFDRPFLWTQRFNLLAIWLYSQLLDWERGVYFQGKYVITTFTDK